MKLTDAELEALYRSATAHGDAAGCPAAETLAAAAASALGVAEREALAAHVARCSTCAEDLRLLAKLRPVVEGAAGRLPEPRPAAGWWPLPFPAGRRTAFAALALVAVAAVSLVVWQAARSRTAPPAPVDRSRQEATVATSPPHRAVLADPPAALSWAAVAGATGYRVTLYDFESTPIWESPPLAEPSVALPDEVRGRLGRGRPVLWRIAVTSGVDRAEIGPFQFTLAGDGAP
jgi:hypothetical protein